MKRHIQFILLFATVLVANAQSKNNQKVALPFIGSRYFNYSGGGTCCFAKITISKNGNCRIVSKGADDYEFKGEPWYSGKFNKVVWAYENKKKREGYKIEKNYITFLKSNSKPQIGCDDEDKPCKFELSKEFWISDSKGRTIYSEK
ncbi:MAG: hypothetical protein ACI7YS_11250 [Flavobacterium sp.]